MESRFYPVGHISSLYVEKINPTDIYGITVLRGRGCQISGGFRPDSYAYKVSISRPDTFGTFIIRKWQGNAKACPGYKRMPFHRTLRR